MTTHEQLERIREGLRDQRELACGILRKLRKMYMLTARDWNIAEEAARRLDVAIDGALEYLATPPPQPTQVNWIVTEDEAESVLEAYEAAASSATQHGLSEAVDEMQAAIQAVFANRSPTPPATGTAGEGKAVAWRYRSATSGPDDEWTLHETEPEFDEPWRWVVESLSPQAAQGCRALSEWHEELGPVVWWKFPIEESAWIGTPHDDTWPGYHTHWTPHPAMPAEPGVDAGSDP